MDETRIGLHTIPRRCITIRGVKPITTYQHAYRNTYLFGGYSPINGDSYTLELPHCDAACFQLYLDGLSGRKPEEFKILVLDNGAFHKAKRLRIPSNIALLFLPPYCPELNPAEKVWRYIKDRIANKAFRTLDEISDSLVDFLQNFSSETIESIVGWKWYKDCVI